MTTLVYDPYDYTIDANPSPVWARLREEAPVDHNERLDLYELSRFDDVRRAHRDPETVSSALFTGHEMMREEPDEFMQGLHELHELHERAGAHALPQAC